MGQSPKGESYNYDNIGLPLINGAADYENGYLKAQKYTTDPKKTANKDDLIFCIRATIGLLVISDDKYCLGRGVAGITNINQTYKEYAFHLINSSIDNFKRAATGSVISGISRNDIENIIIKIPTEDEINKYHSIQRPIFDKIENNRIEIKKLTTIRDTLLPKLMSGEIDVSEINFDLKFFFFVILKLNEEQICKKFYICATFSYFLHFVAQNYSNNNLLNMVLIRIILSVLLCLPGIFRVFGP